MAGGWGLRLGTGVSMPILSVGGRDPGGLRPVLSAGAMDRGGPRPVFFFERSDEVSSPTQDSTETTPPQSRAGGPGPPYTHTHRRTQTTPSTYTPSPRLLRAVVEGLPPKTGKAAPTRQARGWGKLNPLPLVKGGELLDPRSYTTRASCLIPPAPTRPGAPGSTGPR